MSILRNRQKGVALISVLLVFALVTLLAGEIMSRNFIDIRKTGNAIRSKQAYYYALGAEQFARQILYRDFEESDGKFVDHLQEAWAKKNEQLAIENGSITVSIVDLHSKLNLNNMLTKQGKIDKTAANQFYDLLSVVGVNTGFSAILQDWIDEDKTPLAGGAEDQSYVRYLTANQPIADRSEMRLLSGFSFQDYDRLKPFVSALPVAIKYNINTLDKEVIKSLSTNITESDLNRISQRQQRGGYGSLAEWFAAEGKALSTKASLLTVASNYFEINVNVIYDGRVSTLRTQLYRDPNNGQMKILKRLQSDE